MNCTEEKVVLNIADELREMLHKISKRSVIAELLLKESHDRSDLVYDYVDYISISRTDCTKVSYLTKDRMKRLPEDYYWSAESRLQCKPGGFVSKIFVNFNAKDVEIFSNLYTTFFETFEFDVVKGKDLVDWYSEDKYASNSGSLGASCMKYDNTRKYLKIYSQNSDVISMVIMTDMLGKLVGRALIWNVGDIKVMDRIYTIMDDKLASHLKNWADDNNIISRHMQNWYDCLKFESHGVVSVNKFSVKVNIDDIDYYPYLDTFKFLNRVTGEMYNYIPDDIEDNDDFSTLISPDGGKYGLNVLGLDAEDNVYLSVNDLHYLGYLGYKVNSCKIAWSNINETYIHTNHYIYDDFINDYIFNKEYDHLNNSEKILNLRKQKEEEKRLEKEWEEKRSKSKFKSVEGSPIAYSSTLGNYLSDMTSSGLLSDVGLNTNPDEDSQFIDYVLNYNSSIFDNAELSIEENNDEI